MIVDEPLLVLNNGNVASARAVVDLIAEHDERRRIAARLLGIQADAPDFCVRLEQAVDDIVGELQAEPAWLQDVPEPSPIVTHDLEPVTVVRNGVPTTISAAEMRQQVEEASRKAAVWAPEEDGVQYETDVPWASWVLEEQDRAFRSAFADDNAWPREASRIWPELVEAWSMVGHADDVLDALLGGETEIPEGAEYAVKGMEMLAEALVDVADGQTATVARALARKIVKMGVPVRAEPGQLPVEALSEALGWFLGVDATRGWAYELPSTQALKRTVSAWVDKVAALAQERRGVWHSQAAAVEALVLKRATPQTAKAVAQAAYAAR